MKYTKVGYYSVLLATLAFMGGCSDDGNSESKASNPEICDEKSAPCLLGYSCVNATCLKNAAFGEACGDGIFCIEGKCMDGKCSQEQSDNPNSGNIGAQCVNDAQCKQGTCLNRVCTTTAADGESCESTPCATHYVCDETAKTCKKLVNIGEACDDKVVCKIGECLSGKCQALSEDDILKTVDSDGDTISDYYDRCDVDTDGDGTPDCRDFDSDGDTIPDFIEAGKNRDMFDEPWDSDDDTIPDFLSKDSDGNGIPDMYEGCPMADFKYTGADSPVKDKNNPEHQCNEPADTDGDGLFDFQSFDNDGDGLLDKEEIAGLLLAKNGQAVPGKMCGDTECEPGTPENPWDTDGDTIPDYNDTDSDGDTIPDYIESRFDTDNDGNIDIYDLDSDGDTIPDAIEKDWRYTDENGNVTECYTSQDCDGDGLLDSLEVNCDTTLYPMAKPNSIITPDADSDGNSDAAEYAAAIYAIQMNEQYCKTSLDSSLCYAIDNPDGSGQMLISKPEQLICDEFANVEDVFEFYFELPKGGPEQNNTLEFKPAVSQLDLVLNIDVTGSMQKEIDNVKNSLTSYIIPQTKERVTDSAFGISAFADFPVNLGNTSSVRYGYLAQHGTYQADTPWRMLAQVTTDQSTLGAAVNQYALTDGMDYPESGYDSLWQIAKADDVTADKQTQYALLTPASDPRYGTDAITGWKTLDITPQKPDHFGGAGFRSGSLPVVVHITDAPSHGSTTAADISTTTQLKDYIYDSKYIRNAHTDKDVHAAYAEKGIRLITVYRRSKDDATSNKDGEGVPEGAQHPVLLNSSRETDAYVPVCAFQTGANTWTCGQNKCCTVKTSANSVDPDENGQCALSYGITDGTQLSQELVAGIDALVKYGTTNVATRILGEPINGSDKTTACFIKKVEAKQYVAPPQEPEKSCNPKATATKFDSSLSYNDGFTNFAAGTSGKTEGAQLHFTVVAQNDDCVTPTTTAQTFTAFIELYDPTTNLSLGKRQVSIIVPGQITHEVVN